MPKQPPKSLKPPRIPSYCNHRAVGQAYTRVKGRLIYLGAYGTEASRQAYAAVVADVLAGREVGPISKARGAATAGPRKLSVRELADRYVAFAKGYYVKGGQVTNEAAMVKGALDRVVALFGEQPAEAFGPVALKTVRDAMIAAGLARSTINQNVGRIRRAFKHAASDELIPATVPAALETVAGLRAGRTAAREPAPVLPVPDDAVDATLSNLPQVVADMVRLQRLTGMRPGEVCSLRPCDVDRSAMPWQYRPATHKTEHHGRERVVFLGPHAREVLLRYLARDAESFCFRPDESERKRRTLLHELRKTALSCGNRPGTNLRDKPARTPGQRYTTTAYARAVARGCEATWPAPPDLKGAELRAWNAEHRWTPNQLRHAAATEVRAKFGLEAAQVTLGHSSAKMTEHYAEKNLAAGAAVAEAIG